MQRKVLADLKRRSGLFPLRNPKLSLRSQTTGLLLLSAALAKQSSCRSRCFAQAKFPYSSQMWLERGIEKKASQIKPAMHFIRQWFHSVPSHTTQVRLQQLSDRINPSVWWCQGRSEVGKWSEQVFLKVHPCLLLCCNLGVPSLGQHSKGTALHTRFYALPIFMLPHSS